MDDLIDVIEGNRRYTRCLYVYNKIDVCSIEEVCAWSLSVCAALCLLLSWLSRYLNGTLLVNCSTSA